MERRLDVIRHCNEWLEMYEYVLKEFKKLSKKDGYLITSVSFKSNDGFNEIIVSLKKDEEIVHKGISISVDDNNEVIYDYLVASVIGYYLNYNYVSENVDMDEYELNNLLLSDESVQNNGSPIVLSLSGLKEKGIPRLLVSLHNKRMPFDMLIGALQDEIGDADLPLRFFTDIKKSYEVTEELPELKIKSNKVNTKA